MVRSVAKKIMWVGRATVFLVGHTLVLPRTMRRSAIMRHSIVFLGAALVALVAVGMLYPITVADAADVAAKVEAETFDVRPTGTSIVTNTTLYSGGKALRFSNNTAHAKEPVTFTSSGDVVLWARATQSGGSPKLRVSVNGTFPVTAPAKAITNSGAPRAYTFDVNAPKGNPVQIGVKASNTATGRQPFVDYVTFPANPTSGACATGTFDAEYRNEVKTFTTAPVIDRCESAPINHDWGFGSPGAGVNADNFTSRYVGNFNFEAGHYKFDVNTGDGGVRLYVDGVLLLDQWSVPNNTERVFVTKPMTAGTHQVKVEHYEAFGTAKLSVAWAKSGAPPVMAADTFVGRIGVNTHFHFTWEPDYDNYLTIVQRMKEANIRFTREHVNYEPGHPNEAERYMIYRHMVANGIRIMCIADDRSAGMYPITPAKIDYINTQSNNACAYFEGRNEPENEVGWTTSEIVSAQQALFNAVNGSQRPDVPVVGPSIFKKEVAQTIGTAFNPYTDKGANVHPLHQDWRPSFGHPDMQARLDAFRAMTPGKKLVATEDGWSTCPVGSCNQPISVSENVQSKYTLRTLFWGLFDADFERVNLYEMVDEVSRRSSSFNNNGYYGLLRPDLTPKPAYTSLKRLTSLLAEPNAAPFTPQGLSYTLSGSVANVRSYVLQKSNGTHYLVLYQDVPSWNSSANTEISNPTLSTTVNLGSPASRVLVHSPHSSATPVADRAGPVSSVTVSVPDHPVVLEIRH